MPRSPLPSPPDPSSESSPRRSPEHRPGARPAFRLPKDALGARGEEVAADYLRRHGHEVVDRNWRAPHGRGELDLVTLDEGRVVVVEVKTRSSLEFGHPFEAIGPAKLERLHRLGAQWCAAHGLAGRLHRVDAVAVLLPRGGPAVIEHLEGVR